MKRLLLLILAVVLAVAITNNDNVLNYENQVPGNILTSINTISQLVFLNEQTLFKPSKVSQFAWQAQVPTVPVEERTNISWWWWVIGVLLAIGAGMLLYVWMKKDPKKDA